MLRGALAVLGLLCLAALPAGAQSIQRICLESINSTTGATNCPTVSTTNPFPVGINAGTNIIGKVGIDQTTDITTNGVEIAPTAAAAAGITPVVSASAESSHVLKASAGNLYAVYVSNPSASGFLMVFNSATVPIDGAVTPIHCVPVGAASLGYVNFNPGPPEAYATGMSAALSSTGCITKTTAPAAIFHGSVK